jgi:hypothetical protein
VHVSYSKYKKKKSKIYFLNLDLRRDTYEDYTFPLSVSNETTHAHGFELFSLRRYVKYYGKQYQILI